MDTKDITIVIVSFKSDQKLIECLNYKSIFIKTNKEKLFKGKFSIFPS